MARKEKIRSICVIVKTAFSQNNNSAPKAKIRSGVRSYPESDPIRNPILSGIRSDPEADPESDPGFVNGRREGITVSPVEKLINES